MSEIGDYIAGYSGATAERLQQLYDLVREVAPTATESLAWGMPTFKVNGKNAVHFAAHARHIGLYPGADAIVRHAAQLAGFKTSKGAIQLPNDEPLPVDLVRRIVVHRVRLLAPAAGSGD